MSEKDTPPHEPRLILGIIFLALGGVLLALKLGLALPWHYWRYFPVPIIAIGLWGLVRPSRYVDRNGGLWLLAVGLYCLIGAFGLFGLSWWSAWPVYVIAAGISVIMDHDSRGCSRCGPRRDGEA